MVGGDYRYGLESMQPSETIGGGVERIGVCSSTRGWNVIMLVFKQTMGKEERDNSIGDDGIVMEVMMKATASNEDRGIDRGFGRGISKRRGQRHQQRLQARWWQG